MFNTSLSDNGSVGVYKSVIDSTCCYCGKDIPEGDLATFLLSKNPTPEDDNEESKVKLYIVEIHTKCTVDMADELEKINISSLNNGDKITSSATIVHGYMSSDVECIICEKLPNDKSKAIVFASSEINSEDINNNVWCHPQCLDDVCDSLKNIDNHIDEIVAEEI